MSAANETVIWHDLECGRYDADLPLWLELADRAGDPVLEIGAGTGRVALALARAGHAVHALERDAELVAALAARAGELPLTVVRGDACEFASRERFALCIVPMQTVQVLADRGGFLRCARAALAPGGLLAVALLGEDAEPFEVELDADELDCGGVRYLSRPTALRRDARGVTLERRRETVTRGGIRVHTDIQLLAPIDAAGFAREALAAGFVEAERRAVPSTHEHAGSEVVVVRA